jgi:uncharacterized protein (TIGR02001 family)
MGSPTLERRRASSFLEVAMPRILAVTGLLLLSCAARAGVTVTPAVVSDYDFRGISQSAQDPALQMSVDYVHEPTGLYLSAWGSNVRFAPTGDPHVEVDVAGGKTWGDPHDGIGFDLGATWYTYVNASDFNFVEVHAGLAFQWLSTRLSYAPRFNNVHESAWYASVDSHLPLALGFEALLHAGYSGGNYWDRFYGDGYFDWSVGVGKQFGPVRLAINFVDGSDLPDGDNAGCTSQCRYFSTDPRVIASVSTTLPWSAD